MPFSPRGLRRNTQMNKIFLIILCLSFIYGCGIKGDLYMPNDTPATGTPHDTHAAPGGDATTTDDEDSQNTGVVVQ